MYMIQSFADILEGVEAHFGSADKNSPEYQTMIAVTICGILQGLGAEVETIFTDEGYISGFICNGVSLFIGMQLEGLAA